MEELQGKRRALAREAKRLILDGRDPSSESKRDDRDRPLREAEVVVAELERAFYAPDPSP